jgi:uncharacterized phage protein (TIGR01671 family)
MGKGKDEMTREIKFRIWDKEEKKYMFDGGVFEAKIIINNGFFGEHYLPDEQENYIIEQFTGLKDSNGKDIYEGDIMPVTYKFNVSTTKNCVVEWDEVEVGDPYIEFTYTPGFVLRQKDEPHNRFCLDQGKGIIGNIHENPELFK